MKKLKPPFKGDHALGLLDADGEQPNVELVAEALNNQYDLEATFEVAKKLKNQALARANDLASQLTVVQADLEYAQLRLDNTAVELQEANAQLVLIKKDRDYWQRRYDVMASSVTTLYKLLTELQALTKDIVL